MKIEVGFELEFSSNLDTPQLRRSINSLHKGDVFTAPGNKHSFAIHFDGSVTLGNMNVTAEVVTPAYASPKEALRELSVLFQWMRIIDAETNKSCGLHCTIGFDDPNLIKKVDMVKLVMLTDEVPILREFKRLTNDYTRPVYRKLKDHLTKAVKYRREHTFHPELLAEAYLETFKLKYDAINRCKTHRGLVEFRMMGNKNYHLDFDKCEWAVNNFVAALKDSTSKRRDKVYKDRWAGLMEEVKKAA